MISPRQFEPSADGDKVLMRLSERVFFFLQKVLMRLSSPTQLLSPLCVQFRWRQCCLKGPKKLKTSAKEWCSRTKATQQPAIGLDKLKEGWKEVSQEASHSKSKKITAQQQAIGAGKLTKGWNETSQGAWNSQSKKKSSNTAASNWDWKLRIKSQARELGNQWTRVKEASRLFSKRVMSAFLQRETSHA